MKQNVSQEESFWYINNSGWCTIVPQCLNWEVRGSDRMYLRQTFQRLKQTQVGTFILTDHYCKSLPSIQKQPGLKKNWKNPLYHDSSD